MKKFLLSLFSAVALMANATEETKLYAVVEEQSDLKNIAVNVMLDNADEVDAFGGVQFDFSLPAGLGKANYNEDPDEEKIWFQSARIAPIAKWDVVEMFTVSAPDNLLVAMNGKEGKKIKGTSGSLGYFTFDGSSLADGVYTIGFHIEYLAYNGDDAILEDEGDPISIEIKDGTVKQVAAVVPATATVTIWKNDGSYEEKTDYNVADKYVPTENSLLFTTDERVKGTNVVYDNGLTKTCANLVIDDAYAFYNPEVFTAVKASYNRTTDKNIVTICLPFDVPAEKINGEANELSSFDGENVHFKKTTGGNILANTPYVLNNVKAGQIIAEVENTEVNATPDTKMTKVVDDATHFGLFINCTFNTGDEGFDYYGYQNNKFYRFTSMNFVKYRTAITLPIIGELKSGNPAELGIIFDDAAAVELVEAENGKANVYDALGRAIRLNAEASESLEGLQNGVYIVNGKKVIKNK